MPYKITVIGGGSSNFTPQLMRLFMESEVLKGSTVTLMDIDEGRLEIMESISKKLLEKEDIDLKIETTTNRKESLRGADFVIVTIAVGGVASWELDIEIPAKYGIYMPIADSIGPGGMMRAFRHIPVMVGICKELEEVSPNAVVLNYSNPVTSCSMAMTRKSSIANLGLCSCSSIPRYKEYLAKQAGGNVEPEDILTPAVAAGINHCSGIMSLKTKNGDDVLKMIRENTDNDSVKNIMDTYGMYPYCGSHWVEFFPQFCHLKEEYNGKLQGLETIYGSKVHDMEHEMERSKKWENLTKDWADGEADESVSLNVLPPGEHIEVLEIIESHIENENNVHIINTLNNGAISNLPDDAIVEVPAVISGYGISPIHVGALPDSLATFLKQHIKVQELTVEAALSGDRKIALEAFWHDPQIAAKLTFEETKKLLDELLEAHAESLDLF